MISKQNGIPPLNLLYAYIINHIFKVIITLYRKQFCVENVNIAFVFEKSH